METNIVEVENFVQQSEERRGSAFTQEVKRYPCQRVASAVCDGA